MTMLSDEELKAIQDRLDWDHQKEQAAYEAIDQHLALREAVRAYHEHDNNGQLYDDMLTAAGIDTGGDR